MVNSDYNKSHKEVLDLLLLDYPEVKSGKMFGYPAYYAHKKLFACVYQNGVGLKLPEKTVKVLIEKDGIEYFQPMGRKIMKEWVQLNRESSEDYLNDIELFEESISFVASLGQKRK